MTDGERGFGIPDTETPESDTGSGSRSSIESMFPFLLGGRESCDRCGGEMTADTVYHPVLYEEVSAWVCGGCGRAVVRDDEGGV